MESKDSLNGKTVFTTNRGDAEPLPGAEFEVFLNFRGVDTRLNFVDCLYHSMDGAGIRVFRDNEEIKKGETIGAELELAIMNSSIYMPIFSRNYASSAWCLRELAYMVDCSRNKEGKATILPIFFDVDPDDVKLKTGLYHDALLKHEQKFGYDIVQQWKKAMREVALIKGWHLKDRGQGEFIRSIVAQVLIKLNKREKILPDHLVGIQDIVQDVIRLLDGGSLDVHYLVIHGMGGIGKTTLAKIVFNQIYGQFDGCCFLSDIRESSKGGKVVQLQKQLLSEILNFKPVEIFDLDVGINQIKRRFCNKKVLIVLDDLDKMDQLAKLAKKHNWFGLGSRIIITTRDINFLSIEEENQENNLQTDFKGFKVYRMKELCHHDALQLFSKHAFRMDSPPHDYNDFSRDIVYKSGRLPLALEVIGSSLYRKSKRFWKDTSKKLDLVLKEDVLDKLKISFEMLQEAQREIFLDIACYFIGEERSHPYYMWRALDFFPTSEVIVLTRMSLIKIIDDRLFMHDLLKDLGREIVRQEDLKVPAKRSRLWCPKISLDVLQNKKGTENIIALKLTGLSKEHDYTSEELSRLPSLRLLELEGGNLTGDFKNLLSNLRWLSWHHCPSELQAVNLRLWNLVVLKLLDSDIPTNWNGWGPCLANHDLKVVHLMRCHLLIIPDFSRCLNLKILVLEVHCPVSLQIGSSIRKLERLKRLEIIAPQVQLSKFSASLHLDILALPSAICSLKRLSILKLEGQCIQELHPSIGEMTGLTSLSLQGCHQLKELPDSIGKLRSLLVLNLVATRIRELPDSIGDLKRLEKMNLRFTQLRELPNSIGGLESLLDLDLQSTKITQLPASIGYLKRLERLILVESRIRELPDSIGDLKRLEELNLGFTQIRKLPNSIGGLESLRELYLRGTKIAQVPASISYLKKLEHLVLAEIEIKNIPNTIGMLEKFEVLEPMGKSPKVDEQNLSTGITWPPQHWAIIISCDDPQSLTGLPSSLCLLELTDIKSSMDQPFFSNLRYLRYLTELTLRRCWLRHIEFEQLENLHRLNLIECESVARLSGLSRLGKLEELAILSCSQLTEIPDLGEAVSLEELFLGNCNSLEKLPDLSKLHHLRTLRLFHCESLQGLPNIPSTCHPHVHGCPMLGEINYYLKTCEICRKSNVGVNCA